VQIYPAIDIKRGKVARGEILYADDPVAVAERFVAAGATWLHVVDLDCSFETCPGHSSCLRRIAALPGVLVQVGGLLRAVTEVRGALDSGAARAVVATATIARSGALEDIVREVGADRLAAGLDVRRGSPVLRGSTKALAASAEALARSVTDAGVGTLVYRDLDRDGALAGLDVSGAARLVPFAVDVIIAGGGASLADLSAARAAGFAGAIVGRALHEGRFGLEEAIACLR